MKKFCILFLVVFSVAGWAQSGYFGSINGVEIRVNGSPSFKRVSKLKTNSGDVTLAQPLQLANLNYRVNYSRVLTRSIEVVAGYEFARLRSANDAFYRNNLSGTHNLVNPIKMTKHGINVGARYYRKGSLAPLGKYIGLEIAYARAIVQDGQDVIYGFDGSIISSESSFLRRVREVAIVDTGMVNLGNDGYSSFSIRGSMGRNFPITDHLMISLDVSFRLLSRYSSRQERLFGIQFSGISDPGVNENELGVDVADHTLFNLHRYNRIQLGVGVKYQL